MTVTQAALPDIVTQRGTIVVISSDSARIGEPQDIANAALFLTSPLSSWMTGQVLSVSGGFTMV
jgi:7-alpha-hydroxysteroid dehydrogenase